MSRVEVKVGTWEAYGMDGWVTGWMVGCGWSVGKDGVGDDDGDASGWQGMFGGK